MAEKNTKSGDKFEACASENASTPEGKLQSYLRENFTRYEISGEPLIVSELREIVGDDPEKILAIVKLVTEELCHSCWDAGVYCSFCNDE